MVLRRTGKLVHENLALSTYKDSKIWRFERKSFVRANRSPINPSMNSPMSSQMNILQVVTQKLTYEVADEHH